MITKLGQYINIIPYTNFMFESLNMKKVKGTILFADVVNSSLLWKEHEKQMYESLDKQNILFDKVSKKYKGDIIKSIGDAQMIYFDNIDDSVNFSIEIQQELTEKPLNIGNKHIEIRIGFCNGKLIIKKNDIQNHKLVDYYGSVVNSSSRLESNVSPIGGFAFANLIGVINKTTEKILIDNCDYKIIKFTENKKDIEFKRSGRLLTKTHSYIVKNIDELKGIDEIETIVCKLK
jgi:hypothetical protein